MIVVEDIGLEEIFRLFLDISEVYINTKIMAFLVHFKCPYGGFSEGSNENSLVLDVGEVGLKLFSCWKLNKSLSCIDDFS